MKKMLKKILKNIVIFCGILLFAILFLIVTNVPHMLVEWTGFPWKQLSTNADLQFGAVVLLVGLTLFVITFMRCCTVVNKSTKITHNSEEEEFIEIDRSNKGCNSVAYGYNVPIATINDYYSPNGKIACLIKKKGIEPLIIRRQQLIYRSEFIEDVLACVTSLMLFLVTTYIADAVADRNLSISALFFVVIMAVCVATLFVRPVLLERIRSKFDGEVREYELKKIEKMLHDYNENQTLHKDDSCKTDVKLEEIRMRQKELDTTKCLFRKMKIRKNIKQLETGDETQLTQVSTDQKQDTELMKKDKYTLWFCRSLIVVCIIVRLVPISIGSVYFDNAVNDLAVGFAASTWIALLLLRLGL